MYCNVKPRHCNDFLERVIIYMAYNITILQVDLMWRIKSARFTQELIELFFKMIYYYISCKWSNYIIDIPTKTELLVHSVHVYLSHTWRFVWLILYYGIVNY